ncbi:hypothetical protein C8D97_11016 [Pleionea mediterranea]|uniref:Uncharacterized protein n=1 Tax=Pleionea mediterranea TaxID=523701 RepID=A0A316FG63_9GAMM|nr:hypothetical protein C8D97_11016 [Pleionea mediterranea]
MKNRRLWRSKACFIRAFTNPRPIHKIEANAEKLPLHVYQLSIADTVQNKLYSKVGQ